MIFRSVVYNHYFSNLESNLYFTASVIYETNIQINIHKYLTINHDCLPEQKCFYLIHREAVAPTLLDIYISILRALPPPPPPFLPNPRCASEYGGLPTAQEKEGKWQKNPSQGKHREFGPFAKTQGIPL